MEMTLKDIILDKRQKVKKAKQEQEALFINDIEELVNLINELFNQYCDKLLTAFCENVGLDYLNNLIIDKLTYQDCVRVTLDKINRNAVVFPDKECQNKLNKIEKKLKELSNYDYSGLDFKEKDNIFYKKLIFENNNVKTYCNNNYFLKSVEIFNEYHKYFTFNFRTNIFDIEFILGKDNHAIVNYKLINHSNLTNYFLEQGLTVDEEFQYDELNCFYISIK